MDFNNRLTVWEVEEGQWTHDWADENDPTWPKAEAVKKAYELARLNDKELFIDFPLETKARAKELGIDLYGKAQHTRNSITDPGYYKKERFDPFG